MSGHEATPLPAADLAAWCAWASLLTIIAKAHPALASTLEHATLLRCDADGVGVGYEAGSFLVGVAREQLALVTQVAGEHFGAPVEVKIVVVPTKGQTMYALSFGAYHATRTRLEIEHHEAACRQAIAEATASVTTVEALVRATERRDRLQVLRVRKKLLRAALTLAKAASGDFKEGLDGYRPPTLEERLSILEKTTTVLACLASKEAWS